MVVDGYQWLLSVMDGLWIALLSVINGINIENG